MSDAGFHDIEMQVFEFMSKRMLEAPIRASNGFVSPGGMAGVVSISRRVKKDGVTRYLEFDQSTQLPLSGENQQERKTRSSSKRGQ